MTVNIGIERSSDSRWIRDVYAGIAHKIRINPVWIRLAWVGGSLLTSLGIPISIAIYVALGVVLPESQAL